MSADILSSGRESDGTTDTTTARHVLAAAFLGWMLDACDFFIVLFTLDNVAASYGVPLSTILLAPTLTLVTRPLGAFLCGRAADRFGRRPVLIWTIVVYSLIEAGSAFAPTVGIFLFLRALFGIALGGEWGVATSLVMESVPSSWRGISSGILQSGYPAGYLLASLLYLLLPVIGWRGLFIMGGSAVFSAVYIALRVPESPVWLAMQRNGKKADVPGLWQVIRDNKALCCFAVILMMAFNFLSHGSQDLYPKLFLRLERGLEPHNVTLIVVLYNIGGILGGVLFGALSQKAGHQRTIALAAFLTLLALPLWTLPHSVVLLAIGAFCLQFCIQGAWSVVPAYLSDLAPPAVRATFPGLAYQLGNLLAASNAQVQSGLAALLGDGLAVPMMLVVGLAALAVMVLALLNARVHPASEAT